MVKIVQQTYLFCVENLVIFVPPKQDIWGWIHLKTYRISTREILKRNSDYISSETNLFVFEKNKFGILQDVRYFWHFLLGQESDNSSLSFFKQIFSCQQTENGQKRESRGVEETQVL